MKKKQDKEEGEDVFNMGVFSGRHTEDGSVTGRFYMELCAVIKCG